MKLFQRGGYEKADELKQIYRVLNEMDSVRCRTIGLRFNRKHLHERFRKLNTRRLQSPLHTVSVAMTMCDDVGKTPVALTGRSRHGGLLQRRFEEVLDTRVVDYELNYMTYIEDYSTRNVYLYDMETTRSILYDKIPRSAFACYMLMANYGDVVIDMLERMH
jgi:hypothetical protein